MNLPKKECWNPRTIAIDLDHTILGESAAGVFTPGEFGEPLEGARETIQAIRKAGWRIMVFTARDKEEPQEIKEYLSSHGIEVDEVVTKKPQYSIFIDDRAMRFPRGSEEGWGLLAGRLVSILSRRRSFPTVGREVCSECNCEEDCAEIIPRTKQTWGYHLCKECFEEIAREQPHILDALGF